MRRSGRVTQGQRGTAGDRKQTSEVGESTGWDQRHIKHGRRRDREPHGILNTAEEIGEPTAKETVRLRSIRRSKKAENEQAPVACRKSPSPKADRMNGPDPPCPPRAGTGPTQGFIAKLLKVSSGESLTHREGRAEAPAASPRQPRKRRQRAWGRPGPPQPQGQLLDLSPRWLGQIRFPAQSV